MKPQAQERIKEAEVWLRDQAFWPDEQGIDFYVVVSLLESYRAYASREEGMRAYDQRFDPVLAEEPGDFLTTEWHSDFEDLTERVVKRIFEFSRDYATRMVSLDRSGDHGASSPSSVPPRSCRKCGVDISQVAVTYGAGTYNECPKCGEKNVPAKDPVPPAKEPKK